MKLVNSSLFADGPSRHLADEVYAQVASDIWRYYLNNIWMVVDAKVWTAPTILSRESLFRTGEI